MSSVFTFNVNVNGQQEREAQVDRWAELLESSGLSSVTLSLLEMSSAFGFLGQQVLLAIEPLMRGTPGNGIAQLLGHPDFGRQLRDQLTKRHSSDE